MLLIFNGFGLCDDHRGGISALERKLAALNIRVATLRNAVNAEQQPPRPDTVRFHIKHLGYAEGVIIGCARTCGRCF